MCLRTKCDCVKRVISVVGCLGAALGLIHLGTEQCDFRTVSSSAGGTMDIVCEFDFKTFF